MSINFDECNIKDVDTFYKGPTNIDLSVKRTNFDGVGKVMDVYVSAVDLPALGLPADTPIDLVQEVIATLQAASSQPLAEQKRLIESSRLWTWLGNAASVATLGPLLMEVAKKFL